MEISHIGLVGFVRDVWLLSETHSNTSKKCQGTHIERHHELLQLHQISSVRLVSAQLLDDILEVLRLSLVARMRQHVSFVSTSRAMLPIGQVNVEKPLYGPRRASANTSDRNYSRGFGTAWRHARPQLDRSARHVRSRTFEDSQGRSTMLKDIRGSSRQMTLKSCSSSSAEESALCKWLMISSYRASTCSST